MEDDRCSLEKDDVIINKDNEARGICVTGFPLGTKANELVIHFQKRKHGGGDIECIHITEERFAVIIFDDRSVAESVVKMRQFLSDGNVPLKVESFSEKFKNETAKTPEAAELVSELSTRELRLEVEEGRRKKTALEETVRRLQLQIAEEMDRHATIERDLQLALSTTQAELSELRSNRRDWIILREEVTLGRKVLGNGAWGTVREGTFRGSKVAVKEIHELILSDHNRRLFEREMNIASRCRHPNLLQFIGATNNDGSPLFVTELLDSCLRRLLSERELTPRKF